jgi:hypothetical protein
MQMFGIILMRNKLAYYNTFFQSYALSSLTFSFDLQISFLRWEWKQVSHLRAQIFAMLCFMGNSKVNAAEEHHVNILERQHRKKIECSSNLVSRETSIKASKILNKANPRVDYSTLDIRIFLSSVCCKKKFNFFLTVLYISKS